MAEEIDLAGVDLVKMAQAAYNLSVPQGMGFLQPHQSDLTDEQAKQSVHEEGRIALNMDYVNGRACKLVVFREKGKVFMYAPWYDHSDEQLAKLLEAIGVEAKAGPQIHGVACNCERCQAGRNGSN